MVRDESSGGVFFAPNRDGEPSAGSKGRGQRPASAPAAENIGEEDPLAYEPELGDLIFLSYGDGDDVKEKLATIQWEGYSRAHECEGFGLQFIEL